jgi:alkanesulfonate monooxygenase SsuD/methylene tetrahydromethanopterin reductase-like flavin-dependent oxidoreductase (luciferase family)
VHPADGGAVTDFRFGIMLAPQATTWPPMLAAAERVDRLGYDHLWTWDHLWAILGDAQKPIFEGYTVLAGWAGATKHVGLGLLVGANPFRNPGVVAKAIATLDHVSGGRAIAGLGAAWFDDEHRAHGLDFGASVGERLAWLDESAAAIRALLDGETVTSQPRDHYRFDGLAQWPPPIQRHVPIMIGGGGEKKTLRIVARLADYWNVSGPPAELAHKRAVLDAHCADVGRDPSEIVRTSSIWTVIRNTTAAAKRTWAAQMANNGSDLMPHEGHRVFLGPPELVAERLLAHVAAGFETCIVEMAAPYDNETLDRLIGEVKPLVDRG